MDKKEKNKNYFKMWYKKNKLKKNKASRLYFQQNKKKLSKLRLDNYHSSPEQQENNRKARRLRYKLNHEKEKQTRKLIKNIDFL